MLVSRRLSCSRGKRSRWLNMAGARWRHVLFRPHHRRLVKISLHGLRLQRVNKNPAPSGAGPVTVLSDLLNWSDLYVAVASAYAATTQARAANPSAVTSPVAHVSAAATAFINWLGHDAFAWRLTFAYPVRFEILVVDGAMRCVAYLVRRSSRPREEWYVIDWCA